MCEFIGTMPTTTGNTFSDFPPEEFTILAFCDSCGHQSAVDRSSVPEDSVIQELPGRLRCSACGKGLQHPDCVHRGGAGQGAGLCGRTGAGG